MSYVSWWYCSERTVDRLQWQEGFNWCSLLCSEINTKSKQSSCQCEVHRWLCFQWKVTVYYEKLKIVDFICRLEECSLKAVKVLKIVK